MATLKQIDANRRNSQSSTGPRTGAGKAKAALNALKSAIHAESLIIPGENPDELAALNQSFHDRFQPAAPEELCLVDRLSHDEWLTRRLRRTEALLWTNCSTSFDPHRDDQPFFPHEKRLGYIFQNIQLQLARIQSRLNSLERSFHRALMDIARLQKERHAAEAAGSPPQVIEKKPPQSEIGFVSKTRESAPAGRFQTPPATASQSGRAIDILASPSARNAGSPLPSNGGAALAGQ